MTYKRMKWFLGGIVALYVACFATVVSLASTGHLAAVRLFGEIAGLAGIVFGLGFIFWMLLKHPAFRRGASE